MFIYLLIGYVLTGFFLGSLMFMLIFDGPFHKIAANVFKLSAAALSFLCFILIGDVIIFRPENFL